jgi:hypothetical protein
MTSIIKIQRVVAEKVNIKENYRNIQQSPNNMLIHPKNQRKYTFKEDDI